MVRSLPSGALRGALMICAVFCGLSLAFASIAAADSEYRARVTVTNRTGADIVLDPERSFAFSPTWWMRTNTAAFDHYYLNRLIHDGDSRTIAGFGAESYLQMVLVVNPIPGWCGCRAMITASVSEPDGDRPAGAIEVSPGPFAGRVKFESRTVDPFKGRLDADGREKESHLIHSVEGEVVFEKGAAQCCPESRGPLR